MQSLVFSAARNLPELKRFAILVAGEPAETLGGHVDLSHPLSPDGNLAVDEQPGDPPSVAPTPSPGPTATPTAAPKPVPTPRRPAAAGRAEATA